MVMKAGNMTVCMKNGTFRFLNDVWLSSIGTEMCPRLSSPLQASFGPDLFQASLFQLEKLLQGIKQAEGWCLEREREQGCP